MLAAAKAPVSRRRATNWGRVAASPDSVVQTQKRSAATLTTATRP